MYAILGGLVCQPCTVVVVAVGKKKMKRGLACSRTLELKRRFGTVVGWLVGRLVLLHNKKELEHEKLMAIVRCFTYRVWCC